MVRPAFAVAQPDNLKGALRTVEEIEQDMQLMATEIDIESASARQVLPRGEQA